MRLLTKQDKDNINALAGMVDRLENAKLSFNTDIDLILSKGFRYGMSRQSVFGVDLMGNTWQIASVETYPSNNNGRWSETVMYMLDSEGKRIKQSTMTVSTFKESF